jgi:hypothetical protein
MREKIAEFLFKVQHPDMDWGHSGTADDVSWRRFEEKCLRDATRLLSIQREEVKREQLTDEELGEIIRVNHNDRPFKSESAIARGTRQAQLQKILKALEEQQPFEVREDIGERPEQMLEDQEEK